MNQEYDYLFKVLLLGDSGTGKSSLILRYTDDTFNGSLVSSIGVDFKVKQQVIDNKVIKIQIVSNIKFIINIKKNQWDTAGHERFRSITTSYYRGANAIIIVFDLSEEKSFAHVSDWLKQIEKHAKENVLKFLVGNKCDLEDQRKISKEEAKNFADEHNLPYIETSAKDGVNISELFENSINQYLNKTNLIGGEKNIKLGVGNNNDSGCCK